MRLRATDNLYSLHLRRKGSNRAPEEFPCLRNNRPLPKVFYSQTLCCSTCQVAVPFQSYSRCSLKLQRKVCLTRSGCFLRQHSWGVCKVVGLIPAWQPSFPPSKVSLDPRNCCRTVVLHRTAATGVSYIKWTSVSAFTPKPDNSVSHGTRFKSCDCPQPLIR